MEKEVTKEGVTGGWWGCYIIIWLFMLMASVRKTLLITSTVHSRDRFGSPNLCSSHFRVLRVVGMMEIVEQQDDKNVRNGMVSNN